MMGKYSEYDRASLSAGWRIGAWTVAILLVCGGLGWAGWAIKVATSEVKGAGDQQAQINSAKNRTQQQELFRAMYAKIQEYDRNLDAAYLAKVEDPSAFNKTNYTGLVMTCNSAVQDYNAQVGKVSAEKWLPADLPLSIDQANVAFDCKETVR